jgi:protein gp37
MAQASKIEWTGATWNPTVGCTKISPACKHCYAETMAHRLQAMGTPGYENGFKLTLLPHRLREPLERKRPTLYFVNSMSDLFHEEVPFAFIDQVIDTIISAQQHTFQLLTKRVERMQQYFKDRQVPPNLWIGVSAEDRKHGLPRIQVLRKIAAGVRFVSIEPLLEDLGEVDFSGISWVIVGGESGPGARPMEAVWVEGILEQCNMQEIHFFFKQWGAWGADGQHRSKGANGRIFKGRTYDAMPEIGSSALRF